MGKLKFGEEDIRKNLKMCLEQFGAGLETFVVGWSKFNEEARKEYHMRDMSNLLDEDSSILEQT